jgi:hypothetical protein
LNADLLNAGVRKGAAEQRESNNFLTIKREMQAPAIGRLFVSSICKKAQGFLLGVRYCQHI